MPFGASASLDLFVLGFVRWCSLLARDTTSVVTNKLCCLAQFQREGNDETLELEGNDDA